MRQRWSETLKNEFVKVEVALTPICGVSIKKNQVSKEKNDFVQGELALTACREMKSTPKQKSEDQTPRIMVPERNNLFKLLFLDQWLFNPHQSSRQTLRQRLATHTH
jgi:hypothetical protein